MSRLAVEMDGCEDEHKVATIKSSRDNVNFAIYQELPLPWKQIFEEIPWALQFFDYCKSPLTLSHTRSNYLHGFERWRLHCHCRKSFSLQCLSAAVLASRVCRNFLHGTGFDKKYSFYRNFCNKDLCPAAMYVGSVYMMKKHYIYLRLKKDGDFLSVIQSVYFGEHFHVCAKNNYIVVVCRSCYPLTGDAVVVCARRTRRLLKLILGVLSRFHSPNYFAPCWREPRRQRMIYNFVIHGIPIDFRKYCA